MRGAVLLTGASGFLGSHIAERLVACGARVRALVRPSSDTRYLSSLPGVELVTGSVEDEASLANAVRGARGVIHAAALTSAGRARDFERVNTQGTTNLLEAVRRCAPDIERFVHVSSLGASGPSEDGMPRPAGAAPRPVSAYGRSKLAGEREVIGAAHEIPTVVLRPPVVYGPRDWLGFPLYRWIAIGVIPFPASPRSWISTLYVTDCADACVRALDADVAAGSVFDVEDGVPQTVASYFAHIERALGTRARVRFSVPGLLLGFAAVSAETFGRITGRPVQLTRDKVNELRAPHWVCDGSEARAALGWTPTVALAEGTRCTAAWYRDSGWL